jgi:hypothetical protein
MIRKTHRWALAATVLLTSGGAMAAANWSAGFGTCSGYGGTGATVTCPDVAGVNATSVTAVSTSSLSTGSAFAATDIHYFSGGGIGAGAGSPPLHALNNSSAGTEAVVIQFDTSVILNQVTFGWRQNDWDFSVFAYTGGGAPTIASLKLDTTLGGGWSLIENYGTGGGCSSSCSSDIDIGGLNAGNISSSWWVISAYAGAYGGKTIGPGGIGTGAQDYFKLLTVAGTKPMDVPEPASLALVGIALLGVVAASRRKSARTRN